NDKEKLKTQKIQMYPTSKEREKLRKWMGTVRWTYNKVLEILQDDKINISDNQDDVKGKVISLNLGIYTFMTGYDPNGRVVKWGN
ncbi:21449_t:CDS:2, partial [Racocetra persica]